jgi:hypothetical protein
VRLYVWLLVCELCSRMAQTTTRWFRQSARSSARNCILTLKSDLIQIPRSNETKGEIKKMKWRKWNNMTNTNSRWFKEHAGSQSVERICEWKKTHSDTFYTSCKRKINEVNKTKRMRWNSIDMTQIRDSVLNLQQATGVERAGVRMSEQRSLYLIL